MIDRNRYQIIDATDSDEPPNYADTFEDAIECAKMMYDQSSSNNPIIRVFYYKSNVARYELK